MDLQDDPLAEDIAFVFDECKRIMEMGRDVFKLLPKDEAFFDLPHPSGRGKMLCGRAAARRIAKLADEAGRRNGLLNRVTQATLRKPTEELLIQRFVTERRELNRKQIDRFLSSVGRKAKLKCSDITHFIPCTLMTAQDPEELTIGPVVFRNRASFRQRMLGHLKDYGRDKEEVWQRDHARSLMAGAAKFYRQFDWVAEVTVKGCDSNTSELIAERTVTSALDCLHLIFRAQYTYKMRVGGPAIRTDRRAGVTIRKDGRMHPHWSTSWAGQVNFPDGWSEQLEDDPSLTHLLSLSSIALEAAVDPDVARPISRRFLDAARWFGEAARDDRSATRIVKYVTAIERMVMTDEMGDVAKSVSERVAALCCYPDASDRNKWRRDASEIYDLRSRLVHGSTSPTDPKIENGVWLAARIGEETLLNALAALGEHALRAEEVSTKRLAKWYGQVIATIDRQEAAGATKTATVPSDVVQNDM
jgi:hypothetical protein